MVDRKHIDEIVKKTLKNVINEKLNISERKNFLHEYRENTKNNAPLIPINEANAKSLITKHSDNGFIVISPCRGYSDFGLDANVHQNKQKLAEINNKRIKECIKLIKESGYSYTPVYGGFIENQGTENEENVYERSFIIYNNVRGGGSDFMNFEDLYKFGLALAKKYNQDSFLIKAPNENPKYITQDGTVDMEFSGNNIKFNDLSQGYFTDLHKNTHKSGDISNNKPTRFSYVESYINPSPQCYSEAHVRYLNGEIFIPYKR